MALFKKPKPTQPAFTMGNQDDEELMVPSQINQPQTLSDIKQEVINQPMPQQMQQHQVIQHRQEPQQIQVTEQQIIEALQNLDSRMTELEARIFRSRL